MTGVGSNFTVLYSMEFVKVFDLGSDILRTTLQKEYLFTFYLRYVEMGRRYDLRKENQLESCYESLVKKCGDLK